MKPGILTTEFWLHALVAVAIALLTYITENSQALPPWAQPIVAAVGPLVLAWLAKNYGDQRADVKQAVLAAQAAASTPPAAAKALSQ